MVTATTATPGATAQLNRAPHRQSAAAHHRRSTMIDRLYPHGAVAVGMAGGIASVAEIIALGYWLA